MNRLLLHGARYHDREAVFVSRELGETPDWRADRLSIRVALALREDLAVGPGDIVSLLMPLSVRWALVERAVWGLGAATLTVPPGSSLIPRVKAIFASSGRGLEIPGVPVVALDSDWDALLDRGGALDTPERASWFRATARKVAPDSICSIEREVELRHEEWVGQVESLLARFPPERGRRDVLAIAEPSVPARSLLYASWADGFTTVVLGPEDPTAGTPGRRFANVTDSEDFEALDANKAFKGGIDGW